MMALGPACISWRGERAVGMRILGWTFGGSRGDDMHDATYDVYNTMWVEAEYGEDDSEHSRSCTLSFCAVGLTLVYTRIAIPIRDMISRKRLANNIAKPTQSHISDRDRTE